MVTPNSMSGNAEPEFSSSSGSLVAELYGRHVWEGESGNNTTCGGLPNKRSENVAPGLMATEAASSTRKGNPRLAVPTKIPHSTVPIEAAYRVSVSYLAGPSISNLTLSFKAPLKPKGNLSTHVKTKLGSSDNPIDVDALHLTAKNFHMAKGTRQATDSSLGRHSVLKPASKVNKSVRPSLGLHRSVLPKPGSQCPHPGAGLPIASIPYHVSGQSVQKLQPVFNSYPSLPIAPYQQCGAPYSFTQAIDQSQPPSQYSPDDRYAHYPVDPRQYPPIPYLISQPAQHHPKHMPYFALPPTHCDESKYHHPLIPKPADSNALLPHPYAFQKQEEHLRQRAVQCIREFSRPRPRKCNLEDQEVTSGSKYDSPSATLQLNVNETSEQGLRNRCTRNGHTSINRNLDLSHLISHTQLLTEMFHVYPSSRDKVGLREDMESLISVQNQRFHGWAASEKAECLRKKAELFNADIDSDKVVYAFMKGVHSGN
jgi:hypothetical protein